jgi:hypothetical protein
MATLAHPHPAARAGAGTAVAAVQGLFYLVTGVWPLVHIDSFQAVTGPKTDLWLVYTVGLLVAVIGGVLLIAAVRRRVTAEVALLAVGAALALAGIDVVFVAREVIRPIYLADAAVEVLLAAWWGIAWFTRHTARPDHAVTTSAN